MTWCGQAPHHAVKKKKREKDITRSRVGKRKREKEKKKRRQQEVLGATEDEDWCSDGSTPNFLLTSHYALLLLLIPLCPPGAIMPVLSFSFYFIYFFSSSLSHVSYICANRSCRPVESLEAGSTSGSGSPAICFKGVKHFYLDDLANRHFPKKYQ